MYLKELAELLRRRKFPPGADSRPEYVQKGAWTDQCPLGGPAESRCFQLALVDRGTLRGQTGRANLLDTRD